MSIFNEKERAKLAVWMNPVDYFNEYGDFVYIFGDDKKFDIIDSTTARNIETDQVYKLENDKILKGVASYSKFQMLTQVKFNNNHKDAQNYIEHRIMKKDVPYIRVATDYYNVDHYKNRYGVKVKTLKTWKKETIIQDHGKEFMKEIPIFYDFDIFPDNINYKEFRDNRYNLFAEFPHTPSLEDVDINDFPNIHKLMNHIFGDQVELGYKYMKVLYEYPKQILPILVLTSEERQTGKTTFLNLMDMIFSSNYVNIRPEDITGTFNAIYATANIIGIDETVIEKQTAVEKLKSIATQKTMTVNSKFVSQYTVPFYGKIIICTNRDKDFMRIDNAEIRFWIRKVGTINELITNIEELMLSEIPSFLKYLLQLPEIDFTKSRMVFTDTEIGTETLNIIKNESRSGLHKELLMLINDWFVNSTIDSEFRASAIDIKKAFFENDNQKSLNYIHKVLDQELKLELSDKIIRYTHFKSDITKTGKPFVFKRSDFVNGSVENAVNGSNSVNNGDLVFNEEPPF
jgi:hypothetical protein